MLFNLKVTNFYTYFNTVVFQACTTTILETIEEMNIKI